MNLNLSWAEAARACGGTLAKGDPEARIASIATDTRRMAAGQVFWALKGARTDGHEHLAAARRAGGWVVERGRRRPEDGPVQVLEVPDGLKALQALAAHHRRRFDIPLAAVAGSNGKTSTKEMLRSICSAAGPVCATAGNLNNHFGLPLSLLELEPSHQYGIFELGESRSGDIDKLARIAQPTLGLLTNVGPAHLEFFGSVEGAFRCLAELVAAAPPGARIALNLDDPWLASLEGALGERAITYGLHERARVRLLPSPPEAVELLVDRRRLSAALAARGRVHRLNAAAAAAAAFGMGLGMDAIARGLSAFRPAPLRFEERPHPSGAVLVLDCYNANPASMRAGVESFCEAFPAARRILVLGEMKELGPDSGRLHRELGAWLAPRPLQAVFLTGPSMAEAERALREGGTSAEVRHDPAGAAWAPRLRELLGEGAAVFFKASRAVGLEAVAESL